jgi:hypothetical protein
MKPVMGLISECPATGKMTLDVTSASLMHCSISESQNAPWATTVPPSFMMGTMPYSVIRPDEARPLKAMAFQECDGLQEVGEPFLLLLHRAPHPLRQGLLDRMSGEGRRGALSLFFT